MDGEYDLGRGNVSLGLGEIWEQQENLLKTPDGEAQVLDSYAQGISLTVRSFLCVEIDEHAQLTVPVQACTQRVPARWHSRW